MKILNFGSLNIDNVYTVEHFLRPGETMSAEGMAQFCGGKGLNQSIALAKAGATVYHAGCVGAADGELLLSALRESGVDVSFVAERPVPTGHAIIQVNRDGQNCILLFGGANQEITEAQIDETLAAFDAGDLLVLQNEISGLCHLLTAAKKKGMTILLNPSPMTPALLALPLGLVDYFLLNEIEAQDICGEAAAPTDYPRILRQKYPSSRIVLTLGEKGSIYEDDTHRWEQPAFRVNAVDTTAAGDTFTGFFIAALAAGTPVPEALTLGAKAAAISVCRKGASSSIPTLAEVRAF